MSASEGRPNDCPPLYPYVERRARKSTRISSDIISTTSHRVRGPGRGIQIVSMASKLLRGRYQVALAAFKLRSDT